MPEPRSENIKPVSISKIWQETFTQLGFTEKNFKLLFYNAMDKYLEANFPDVHQLVAELSLVAYGKSVTRDVRKKFIESSLSYFRGQLVSTRNLERKTYFLNIVKNLELKQKELLQYSLEPLNRTTEERQLATLLLKELKKSAEFVLDPLSIEVDSQDGQISLYWDLQPINREDIDAIQHSPIIGLYLEFEKVDARTITIKSANIDNTANELHTEITIDPSLISLDTIITILATSKIRI